MLSFSCRYPSYGWAHLFLPTKKTERKSVSLPRTGSRFNATMSSSRVAAFASRSAFNAYTLFLFSKSDMKTTVIPVVCNQGLYANGILTVGYCRASSLWALHPCRPLIQLPISYNASCGSGSTYSSSIYQTNFTTQKKIYAINPGDRCRLAA